MRSLSRSLSSRFVFPQLTPRDCIFRNLPPHPENAHSARDTTQPLSLVSTGLDRKIIRKMCELIKNTRADGQVSLSDVNICSLGACALY